MCDLVCVNSLRVFTRRQASRNLHLTVDRKKVEKLKLFMYQGVEA
jgi:hypothetical protein